jgi:hypothetical protein
MQTNDGQLLGGEDVDEMTVRPNTLARHHKINFILGCSARRVSLFMHMLDGRKQRAGLRT